MLDLSMQAGKSVVKTSFSVTGLGQIRASAPHFQYRQVQPTLEEEGTSLFQAAGLGWWQSDREPLHVMSAYFSLAASKGRNKIVMTHLFLQHHRRKTQAVILWLCWGKKQQGTPAILLCSFPFQESHRITLLPLPPSCLLGPLVLIRPLNNPVVCDFVTCSGRAFHKYGSTTEKTLSPFATYLASENGTCRKGCIREGSSSHTQLSCLTDSAKQPE